MKTAAIVVWFYPNKISNGETAVSNILTYSNYFEKVIIVDNTPANNSELAKQIPNSIYIPLNENKGIACALNVGCKKALENGFDWVLTMDQDSFWDADQISNYIKWANQISVDSKIASIAANQFRAVHSVLGDIKDGIKKAIKKVQEQAIEEPLRVICSGNFISLKVWQEIDGFNEQLFIDEVDHDYCFKLLNADYKIIKNNTIQFHHAIGDTYKTFFPRVDKHNDFRLYYILRNNLYIIKKYPDFAKKCNYKKNLKKLVHQCIYFTPKFFSRIKIWKKAQKDVNELI